MRAIHGKPPWGRALGVYLAEGRLTLTDLSAAPWGVKVRATVRQSLDESGPGKFLEQWLQENLTPRERKQVAVCIGLGAEQTYFTTRLLPDGSQEAPTVETLLPSGEGGPINATTAAIDFLQFKLNGNPSCCVAACRRAMAEDLLQIFKRAGVNRCRLEPAPWALADAAKGKFKVPRSWKIYIRVLLSDHGGLAILIVDDRPVVWRRFATIEGEQSLNIASAVRHIQVHAMSKLGIADIAGVVIQGTTDEKLAQNLPTEIEHKILFAPQENLDDSTCSVDLAVSARKMDGTLDLFKTLRPPPSLKEAFPRKLAAGLVLAILAMGAVMWNTLSDAEASFTSLRRQGLSHNWASALKTPTIKKDKKLLQDEVEAVEKFLSSRMIWSDYLRDLPTRLPPNAALESFSAYYEMDDMSGKSVQKRVNRSISMRGIAMFTDRNQAPKEIDAFLDSLRSVELLKRDFPLVNLAEIKWRKDGLSDVALFTIVAMPKQKGTAMAAGKTEH